MDDFDNFLAQNREVGFVLLAVVVVAIIYAAVQQKRKHQQITLPPNESANTAKSSQSEQQNLMKAIRGLVGLGVGAFMLYYFWGGGLEKQANTDMQRIEDKVAADAEARYQIAKRNGTKMDVCVQAGFVAAAYLQAKNETGYQRWKGTEKNDCEVAGLKQR